MSSATAGKVLQLSPVKGLAVRLRPIEGTFARLIEVVGLLQAAIVGAALRQRLVERETNPAHRCDPWQPSSVPLLPQEASMCPQAAAVLTKCVRSGIYMIWQTAGKKERILRQQTALNVSGSWRWKLKRR
jgi:hypothetical protein